jgi:hypothetical protein
MQGIVSCIKEHAIISFSPVVVTHLFSSLHARIHTHTHLCQGHGRSHMVSLTEDTVAPLLGPAGEEACMQ